MKIICINFLNYFMNFVNLYVPYMHKKIMSIKYVLFHLSAKGVFPTTTTGIRVFAECWILCRVPFVGHSAKKALPRAALGKVRLSAKSPFTECWTLGRGQHSAKTRLPSVKHSAKKALGKGPSLAVPKLTAVSLCRVPTVGSRQRCFFAECRAAGTRQRKLYRVSYPDTRQSIFLFF
jgi:hypothetical protein